MDREVRRLMKMGEELRGLYETEAEEGGGGSGGGADAGRRHRRLRNRPAKGGPSPRRRELPRTEVPNIPEGASPFPGNNRGYNFCQG